MSYRPQVKADSNGTTQDLPLDAETVQGKTPVFTTTDQTITGIKSFTSGLKVSGRVANSGDDEGIVINTASNGYAGVCLGNNSGRRSVFYLNNEKAFWRYNNGSSSYDLNHPGKSGTIATIDDIPDISGKSEYYLHTIRAYQSSSPLSFVAFSVISTQSTAYTKSTLYSAFPNKVFHASGYCGTFIKTDGRINYVYLDSATTIKMYHGNDIGTSQTYGGSYFADEVKRIA